MHKQTCPSGHALRGKNLYRHANKRYCRTCRATQRTRRPTRQQADDLLLEREIRWLIDLPNILEELDRNPPKVCG